MSQNRFITVPATQIPDGPLVPSFQVGQYACSRGEKDLAVIDPELPPWVRVNYNEARALCATAGFALITETQALAIAWNIAQQGINWTGGKVGEGDIFQGLHDDSVECAMPGNFEPPAENERRWHQLANGERIFDFAGNAYTWIFDDVQGDDNGLVAKAFADDSISLKAPYPRLECGMGWRPKGGADWSGGALVRGGFWCSGSYAGVFTLYGDWPDDAYGNVGFRCTNPGL